MAPKSKPLVEEPEPKFKWVQTEGCDTLIVHFTDYLKENLKVQVTASRHLRVIGERKGYDGKPSRFQKEFSLPEDCDVNGITAKFEGRVLKIKLPKVAGSALQREEHKQEIKSTSVPSTAEDETLRAKADESLPKGHQSGKLNDENEGKTADEKEAADEKQETEEKYKKKLVGKLWTKKVILLAVLIVGVGVALGLRMLRSKGNDVLGVKMNNASLLNVSEKSCICEM